MPNNNNDSIVDRILRGEYDIDNPEQTTETSDGCVYDADEDEDVPSGEDDEVEPYEDEEEDEGYSPDPNDDFPSDEYYEEYMEDNNLQVVPEPAAPVGAKYTKFRTDDDNSTQDKPKVNMKKTTTTNVESTETPKNATTPTPTTNTGTATAKRRGRPSKLIGHEAVVARLYNEGVSTKTLSEKFTCSVSSVINCLRGQNVQIRPKGRRKGS